MSDEVEIENEALSLAIAKDLDVAVVPWAGTLNKGTIGFDWYIKGTGFGQLVLEVQDGKLKIDSEAMGPEFIQHILSIAVDKAEII